MSEEILINVTPPETRVALIENGVVQEVLIERTASRGLVGNIYKGKICRVLPGMQAAFVDAGLARAAFLHASDMGTRDPEHPVNITDLVQELTAAMEEADYWEGRSGWGEYYDHEDSLGPYAEYVEPLVLQCW